MGQVELDDEMTRLTDAGAIIAGGAALGMLTNTPYGDVDYYVGAKDYAKFAEILGHTRKMLGTFSGSYLMVTKWVKHPYGNSRVTTKFTEQKRVPVSKIPTKVEHPELYRLASGLNPTLPLKFQSATTPDKKALVTFRGRSFPDYIDVIPTPDDDPRDFVAREFDLSVCKVCIGRGGVVYAMYPNDIRAKRVSQIFDRRMTYNKSKLGTLELRLKKYIDRGYEYYEYSRLYKLDIPGPLTLGHGISDDPELGRLLRRVRASIDEGGRLASPFYHSFRRAISLWTLATGRTHLGDEDLPPVYAEWDVVYGYCPTDIGFAPTPEDIELAHALFRFYPLTTYKANSGAEYLRESRYSTEDYPCVGQLMSYNPAARPDCDRFTRAAGSENAESKLSAEIEALREQLSAAKAENERLRGDVRKTDSR